MTSHITDGTTTSRCSPSERRRGTTISSSTVALSSWATTVPHALPASPQSRPKTSTSSKTRLAAVHEASPWTGRVGWGRPAGEPLQAKWTKGQEKATDKDEKSEGGR